jgi:hypothetical protein
MAAKRPDVGALKNARKLTERTEPTPPAQPGTPIDDLPATGHTKPVGIGLKESEYAALREIADATGIAANSLGRFAIREFIKAYRRGEIDLTSRTEEPPPPKKKLRME